MTGLTPDEVRTEVGAWLDDNWDPELTVAEWWKRLAEAGYTHPMLPEAAGGRGWTRDLANAQWREFRERAVMGPPSGLGYMLAGPTIAQHGTAEQVARFLPPILDGTVAWCQLFSEPGAGSDLAGLQCRAERDGDEWVVTGQKVWTSGAHSSQWGMLIARTDPDQPKHTGISYFAMRMDQPGIDIRPLQEMTGRSLFNEVFLDGARLDDADMIGDLNQGWAVANTTLTFERASLGGGGHGLGTAVPGPVAGHLGRRAGDFVQRAGASGVPAIGTGSFEHLCQLARKLGRDSDPVIRQHLARLYCLGEVNRLSGLRAKEASQRTGAEANLGKLIVSELFRQTREVGNLIIGADGMLDSTDSATGGVVQEVTLFSPGPSIYGGTDQVQRNIIGERVLGLPKEPGPPKDTPFKDLAKS